MQKIFLTILLCIAAFCVNAQTKDSTYKTIHDSLQSVIVKDTVYNWYDSTFYHIDSSWTYCKIRGRSLLSFYWLFGGKATYRYCDTIKRPRRTYNDSTLTITKTSYDSSICCHIVYGSHQEWKWLPTTHDTTVKIVMPDTYTRFGIKINNDKFINQLTVAQQLGVYAIRPNALDIKSFSGDLGNAVTWNANGLFPVLNCNWIDNPTLKPYNFVSGADTGLFKINFEKICIAVKSQIGTDIILVMENEPTNEGYYNWDSAAYVHELQMAITIAHKYGLYITDGCTHLQLIELCRQGKESTNKNGFKVRQLMNAYKKLALDFVNVHTSYDTKNGYPVQSIKVTTDYLRQQTNNQNVIANEYSMTGATQTVVNWFISQWKEAGYIYVLAWSGDNTKSDAYNIGTKLTDVGIWYRDAIK